MLAARFWLLPGIERYRDAIVARASEAIGLPVRIGGIEAGWLGLRPQITLTDVRIHDEAGREALVLPAVDNVVGWRSLVALDLRLHSLAIDGPKLTVRRDAGGVLHVAGFRLPEGGAAPGGAGSRALQWLLEQDDIQVRNAEIEWLDEKRAAPPLLLQQVELRLRLGAGEVGFGLAARPPAALAESLELRGTLRLPLPAAGSGRVYASVGSTELAAWRPWIDYPLDVRRGQGALRLWAAFEAGELREITADVALQEAAAVLGAGLPPLELARLRGRLNGRIGGEGYELTARDLSLEAAGGPALQPTDFRVNWKPAGGTAAESGALTARRVELEPLSRLSGALPLPAELRALAGELAPRGELADLRLEWQGAAAAPDRYTLRARLASVGARAWRELPAFSGLTGSLDLTETKGRLQLRASNFAVSLGRLFPEPDLQLDTLTGQVDWERTPPAGYSLRLASIGFANRDLAGAFAGTYSNPGSGRGRIDVTGSLSRADAGRISRYLPHGELMGGPKLRQWLVSSVLAGQGSEVQLRLRGDLARFPFHDPASGQFLVTGRFRGGVLDYANGWPRMESLEGELRFERDRMEITGRSGAIFGARLADVRASIASLSAKANVLEIVGQAEGPSADFLRYVEASPLKRTLAGATSAFAAAGRGKLRLRIGIPLETPQATKLAGDYEFAANTLTLHPQLPPLERAGGRVSFTDAGVTVHDVRARLFGGPVAINGGTRPGGAVEIAARGEATIAGLGPLLEEPWRRSLSGAASYAAAISVKDGLTRIGVESSLRGMASALPAPLDKAAADALALRLELLPAEGGARDRVSIALGRRLAAEILRRRQGDAATAAMAVQRASVAFAPEPGQPLRLPERPGTLVYGALPSLDLDAWLALAPRDAGGAALGFDLRTGVLDAYGRRMHNVTLKGNTDAGGWASAVSADEIAGDLGYRAGGGGRLTARLAHFSMPAETPGAAARSALARTRAPQKDPELPAVDFTAERFAWRGKQFERVELQAAPAGADWKVEKLAMANAESALLASGLWRRGAAPLTSLDFTLSATDTGSFLQRIGYPGMVKGARTKLRGTLAWRGDPSQFDLASLSGHLELDSQEGQFLEVDPGFGKLFALMSLQALPRRVTLDFRDVFSKGFAFDAIQTTAQVDAGVMKVAEFRMRGSAAEVEMTGQVNLPLETQDLKVRVVPSLGSSAAGAVALVNPIAGAAALIAQWVLKNPLGKIFAYEYAVTGGWAEPRVERLNAPPSEERPPQ